MDWSGQSEFGQTNISVISSCKNHEMCKVSIVIMCYISSTALIVYWLYDYVYGCDGCTGCNGCDSCISCTCYNQYN